MHTRTHTHSHLHTCGIITVHCPISVIYSTSDTDSVLMITALASCCASSQTHQKKKEKKVVLKSGHNLTIWSCCWTASLFVYLFFLHEHLKNVCLAAGGVEGERGTVKEEFYFDALLCKSPGNNRMRKCPRYGPCESLL